MVEVKINGTAAKIDEAIVNRAREPGYNLGIAASEMGKPCTRQKWYTFRWLHELEKPDAKGLRIFETGEIYEERLLNWLEQAEGLQVQRVDPETGKQIKIALAGGHLRGKLDGRAVGLVEAPSTVHTVECKSHNLKSYTDLRKRGVKLSKPEHFAQTQLYMHAVGDKRAAYYAICKDDESIWFERLEYDAEYCMKLEVEAEHIVQAETPPPKLHASPDLPGNLDCKFCKHVAICQRDQIPKVSNCRNCTYAKPLMDGKASWHCGFHNKLLTYNEQKAGCPAHLYIPELIPGTVEWFDEEAHAVHYKLKNGKEWRDGGSTNLVKPVDHEPDEDGFKYLVHQESGSLIRIWPGEPNPLEIEGCDPCLEECTKEQFLEFIRRGYEVDEQADQYYGIQRFYCPDTDRLASTTFGLSVADCGVPGEWFPVTREEAKNLLNTGSKWIDG